MICVTATQINKEQAARYRSAKVRAQGCVKPVNPCVDDSDSMTETCIATSSRLKTRFHWQHREAKIMTTVVTGFT